MTFLLFCIIFAKLHFLYFISFLQNYILVILHYLSKIKNIYISYNLCKIKFLLFYVILAKLNFWYFISFLKNVMFVILHYFSKI